MNTKAIIVTGFVAGLAIPGVPALAQSPFFVPSPDPHFGHRLDWLEELPKWEPPLPPLSEIQPLPMPLQPKPTKMNRGTAMRRAEPNTARVLRRQ